MKKLKLSSVGRIILVTLICITLVWSFYLYEQIKNKDNALSRAKLRTQSEAQIFSEFSISSIKRIDELLLDIQSRWNGDQQSFSAYIDFKKELIKDIAFQVAVIDKQGLLTYSNLATTPLKVDLSSREHFKIHSDNPTQNQLFISRPLVGKVSGKWSIQFTRPIFRDGKFAGVIVISIDPSYFGLFGKSLASERDTVLAIFRDTGERMARFPVVESSYGQILKDLPSLRSGATLIGNFEFTSSFDGVDRIYGYSRDPNYGLTFIAGESKSLILAPVAELAKNMLLFCSFATVLICIFSYLFYKASLQRQQSLEAIQLASLVYKNSSEAMAVTDSLGSVININPAFTELTFYTLKDVLGKNLKILKSGEYDDEFWQSFWSELNSTGKWRGELRNRRKNGDLFYSELTIDTISMADSNKTYRVALFRDVTEMKRNARKIWQQANYDLLTGLPNRHFFLDKLYKELKHSRQDQLLTALLFIDLDHFKEINDNLGHAEGDTLLKIAANRLLGCVREFDVVARMGGDEFTIILRQIRDLEDIEKIAQKIIESLGQPFVLSGAQHYVTPSIGIAVSPDDTKDPEALIKYADQAMYVSKNTGRNTFTFFASSMQQFKHERMRLTNDFRNAIEHNEFQVYYQPIFDLQTGRISKAEALVRWVHPDRGIILPDEFIGVAEELGLVEKISSIVLSEVLLRLKEWEFILPPNFQICINRSASEFKIKNSPAKEWADGLSKFGLRKNSLVLEITESALMDHDADVMSLLTEFSDAEIPIALDDFGTGYSSLSYLMHFPVDFLKIDKSFIHNLTTSTADPAICEAIIFMAHRLGIKVIAEGVEDQLQIDLLVAAGCDLAQGFYYSQPLTSQEFLRLVENTQ